MKYTSWIASSEAYGRMATARPVGFCLGGRDVSDGSQKLLVIEPIDPVQGSRFDRAWTLPHPPMDIHSLEQSVDGFD